MRGEVERGLGQWLLRVAMRSFPRELREQSGEEILETIGQRAASLRSIGRSGRMLFVVREIIGLVGTGVALRRERHVVRRRFRAGIGDGLWRDLRAGVRALWRERGFSVVAVLVLGLATGASVSIFSAVNAVLLRPMPFADPEQLLALWEDNAERGWVRSQVAPANWLDWRERVPEFSGIAAYNDYLAGVEVDGSGEALRALASGVSGNFFEVLGVKPLLGRVFTDEETWSGGERVVVLSYSLWQRAFHGDPGIVGRLIQINRGRMHRVIGVMPPEMRFPREQTELWAPMGWSPADRTQAWFRRAHIVRALGRLAPGVTEERARLRLQEVGRALEREYPELNAGMKPGTGPLRDYLARDAKTGLIVLLGAVLLLLVTACANIGNLVLVRGVARERELAVRGALGASRWRLMLQLVTENGILATAGGGLGILLGALGTRLLALQKPAQIETLGGITMDMRVLAFAVLVTGASAVLLGVLPALRGAHIPLTQSLRDASRTTAGARPLRATAALVITEVALAMMLVTGATVLARNLMRLQDVETGVDTRNVLTLSLSLPTGGYEERDEVVGFQETLLQRLRAVPGVLAAGATTSLPLTESRWNSDFTAEGWAPERAGSDVHHREIMPGYQEAMGVRLVRGRLLDQRDRSGAELTVLINETLARRYFENEDPLGRRIAFDRVPEPTSVWRTIVGVVSDERQWGVAEVPRPEFLAPLAQDWNRTVTLVIRTQSDPRALLPEVRAQIRSLDAALPVFDVRTMEEVHAASLARERFVMMLFGLFAILALVLGLVGVYGVVAQSARARFPEVGIRLALGARPAEVQRLIAGRALVLAAAGIGIGLIATMVLSGWLRALLHEIQPNDPVTYVGVAVLLAVAATLASWLPAWRTSRSSVISALRLE